MRYDACKMKGQFDSGSSLCFALTCDGVDTYDTLRPTVSWVPSSDRLALRGFGKQYSPQQQSREDSGCESGEASVQAPPLGHVLARVCAKPMHAKLRSTSVDLPLLVMAVQTMAGRRTDSYVAGSLAYQRATLVAFVLFPTTINVARICVVHEVAAHYIRASPSANAILLYALQGHRQRRIAYIVMEPVSHSDDPRDLRSHRGT